jgi:hypothetical protein
MASARLRRLYQHERKHPTEMLVGFAAVCAWSRAKVRLQWDALESLGLVRLRAEPDESMGHDDVCCCDDPDCPAHTDPICGLIGEYRIGDRARWQHGGSVWGITGENDPTQGDCAPDIMSETLDAFKDARKDHLRRVRDRRAGRCTTCHGSGRLQSTSA